MYLVLIFCLFGLQASWPQNSPEWRSWTVFDGLGESGGFSVTVNPTGRIFVNHSLMGKISILDGYTVETIPTTGSFFPVYEIAPDQIWTLYWSDLRISAAGLLHYINGRWEQYEIENLHTLSSSSIWFECNWQVFPVNEKQIIILFPDQLMVFDTETKQTSIVKNVDETALGRFNHATITPDRAIWITGENGLIKMSQEGGLLTPQSRFETFLLDPALEVKNPLNPIARPNEVLFMVVQSKDGLNRSLVQFQRGSWHIILDQCNDLRCGWVDQNGTTWIRSGSSILYQIHEGKKEQLQIDNHLLNDVFHFAFENNQNFWLSTWKGVFRYTTPLWKTKEEIEPIARFSSMFVDEKDRIWYFSRVSIRLFQDGQWKEYRYPEGYEISVRSALVKFNDGTIPPELVESTGVFSSKGSLMLFDPRTGQPKKIQHPYNRKISDLQAGKDGTLWLITKDEGDSHHYLERYDGNRFETVIEEGKIPEMGAAMVQMELEDGSILLGGGSGFQSVVLYKDGNIRTFTEEEYTDEGVICAARLGNGKIWVGGRNKVSVWDGVSWKVKRGDFNRVYSIIQSRDGSVWVGTGSGAYRYYRGSWVDYTEEDGLASDAVWAMLEDSQGRIWAGTEHGISHYDPSDRSADPDPPMVEIPQDLNTKKVSPSGEAKFVFTGMDKWKHTRKQRLLYSYRVDEGDWSPYTTKTIATEAGLSAGPHRFDVRAMDRNWNESEPETWDFIVLLPWYKEPGFLLSTILVFLFAGYAINRHFKLRLSYETLRQTQNQLIQSEKMASLGQLVAGIAHEINNPVNFIRSNIQPLKDYLFGYKKVVDRIVEKKDRLPDEIRTELEMTIEQEDLEFANEDSGKLIQSFEDGSDRIAHIVADLRLYSRGDDDYYSPFDLHEAIDSSLTLLHNRYKEHVTLHKDYGDLPKVTCSPGKINQVFLNLLGNAEDAIEGEGNVWISTHQEDENIIVTIRDDGKGISPENLAKVFDPFFTTKPVGSGTGLGLSLSFGIIEQHGGTIAVESEEGKGTVFTVKLPIKRKKPAE